MVTSSVPNEVIVEGEIFCRVMASIVLWWRPKWVESQSTRGTWAVTLLSRKSCALTISYSFCPSGKGSIQQNNVRMRKEKEWGTKGWKN